MRPVVVTDPPRADAHDKEAACRAAFQWADWGWTAPECGTRSRS
jgi:hypothetical protein